MSNNKLEELEKVIKSISDFDKDKEIPRIHKDNMFNKGHSLLLSSFNEIQILSNRLFLNIENSITQERFIQSMPEWKNKTGVYPEVVQVELKKSDQLKKEIRVDFKALYLFSVILLDQYVKFLHFINPQDDIKSGTVEKFIKSLNSDPFYKELNAHLGNISDQITEKLNFYRSKKIVHRPITNEDTWFMNDMRGDIKISHINQDSREQTTTIQPGELIIVVKKFFEKTWEYFIENKTKIN